jgi:hypothetical protein
MEKLKKIFKKRIKPRQTATAEPKLERAILPKAERRIKRGDY